MGPLARVVRASTLTRVARDLLLMHNMISRMWRLRYRLITYSMVVTSRLRCCSKSCRSSPWYRCSASWGGCSSNDIQPRGKLWLRKEAGSILYYQDEARLDKENRWWPWRVVQDTREGTQIYEFVRRRSINWLKTRQFRRSAGTCLKLLRKLKKHSIRRSSCDDYVNNKIQLIRSI